MYRNYIKRMLDIVIAFALLPLFAVLFLAAAPAIVLEDRGPVFYNTPRLGYHGRIFKMYKFRSMKVAAPDLRNEDGSTYNGDNDPRVTRIGKVLRKTSVDEIPQILNVLKGEMSLIGPRPDLPDILAEYSPEERKKLDVRPGITGYSQAYYRNQIELHDRFRQDLYYVENLSFCLDCRIIFQTIKMVCSGRGIYRDEKGKKIVVKE